MTDDQKPDESTPEPDQATPPPAADATSSEEDANQLPEEWKPEPREWTWKDLFTAPMLAFKFKALLISVVTIIVLALFKWGWGVVYNACDEIVVLAPIVFWAGWALGAAIFGLGATLVSVFMKADLLDDEFLSLKEAWDQAKGRFLAALMVPVFLVLILAGFNFLIYLAELVGSIPIVGPLLYALLYPLGFLLALFTVLLAIGVILSIFVGPAVVAIRRHGWFDNVIDTFEAVGTKPHVLILNVLLTFIMMMVCYSIGQGAMSHLASFGVSKNTPGHAINRTEARATTLTVEWLQHVDPWLKGSVAGALAEVPIIGPFTAPSFAPQGHPLVETRNDALNSMGLGYNYQHRHIDGWTYWFAGPLLAIWKTLFTALLFGYALNIFLAGGMLTYLAVREDDYWDDEDLDDLDQLAKELEEEAKKEEEEAAKAAAAEGDKATDEKADASEKKDDKPADDKKDDKPASDKPASDKKDDKPADDDKDKKAEDKKDDDKPADDKKAEDDKDKKGDDKGDEKSEDKDKT